MTYPKPKKNPSALLSAGIALVVALCCGGGVAVLGDDDKPAPTSARPSASAQQAVDLPAATLGSTGSPKASPTPARTTAKPTRSPSASPKPKPTPAPKRTTAEPEPAPKPRPKRTEPSVQQGVHPGAFCSVQGARGISKKGVPMVCTTTATDTRKRWRRA